MRYCTEENFESSTWECCETFTFPHFIFLKSFIFSQSLEVLLTSLLKILGGEVGTIPASLLIIPQCNL